jgi:uncharacterized protein (TIGR02099 family)
MVFKNPFIRLGNALFRGLTKFSWAPWRKRIALGLSFTLILIIAGHVLIRFWLWPQIDTSKERIQQLIQTKLGVEVQIDDLRVTWGTLRPIIEIKGVRFTTAQEKLSLLNIAEIRAELGWLSLYYFAPHFHEIQLIDASIVGLRDRSGQVSIAGFPIGASSNDFSAENWLFRQDKIVAKNTSLVWQDDFNKKMPQTVLIKNISLANGFRSHLANLDMDSPWNAQTIHLEGDFVHFWRGQPGNWRDWIGDFIWKADGIHLEKIARDFVLPIYELSGLLSSDGKMSFNRGMPDGGSFNLAIEAPRIQLKKDKPLIAFGRIETEVAQSTDANTYSVTIQKLAWREDRGTQQTPLNQFNPMSFSWKSPSKPGDLDFFTFSANKISLDKLNLLAINLPLPSQLRGLIEKGAPSGDFENILMNWSERPSALPLLDRVFDSAGPNFDITAQFNNLSIKELKGPLHSFSNLSGSVKANEKEGSLQINSQNLKLHLDEALEDPHMQLDQAKGRLSWSKKNKDWQIIAKDMTLSNPDLAIGLNATYDLRAGKQKDNMKLDIQFQRAKVNQVYRYLPVGMDSDARAYIKFALVSGDINNGVLHMQGDPNQAPFANPKDGDLTLNLPITKTAYRPAPLLAKNLGEWPQLNQLEGRIQLNRAKLNVDIESANFQKVALKQIKASVTDLTNQKSLIQIKGILNGPIEDMMDYLKPSPVLLERPTIATSLSAKGNAKVDLDLAFPMDGGDGTKLNTVIHLENNEITWGELPSFKKVNGKIRITEKNPEFETIQAELLGGSFSLNQNQKLSSVDKKIFALQGNVDIQSLKKHLAEKQSGESKALVNLLSGGFSYQGNLTLSPTGAEAQLNFNLANLISTLPKPLDKIKGKKWDGQLKVNALVNAKTKEKTSNWSAKFGDLIFLQGNKTASGLSQAIGIGAPATLAPSTGTSLVIDVENLNFDEWRKLFSSAQPARKDPQSSSSYEHQLLDSIAFRSKQLTALNREWININLKANQKNGVWSLQSNSPQLAGQLEWQESKDGPGKLSGKLNRLHVPPPTPTAITTKDDKKISIGSIPQLNLAIDDLVFGNYKPGAITIKTSNSSNLILIDSLVLNNPQGNVSLTGRWTAGLQNNNDQTSIDATVDIKNLGGFVTAFGNPNEIEGGKGKLLAKLDWEGPAIEPIIDTLSGNVTMNLENGRLLQVSSGAAKLLDVLSLESLLKFATLNVQGTLNNVVTPGTPFNKIDATFQVRNGIARTNQFTMDLNQAKVNMTGRISIVNKTQDLRITIFPTLDATAGALALFAVNPIVGLGALVGQYLVTGQMNKSLQSDYLVQGSWDKPDVIPLDQKGQPLDPKVIDSIRAKRMLREQGKPNNTPNSATPNPTSPSTTNPNAVVTPISN